VKVQLLRNLGVADARRLALDGVREGDVIDVDSETAVDLLKRGWAAEVASKVKTVTKSTVKGVPE
jgi:hypothetical protein